MGVGTADGFPCFATILRGNDGHPKSIEDVRVLGIDPDLSKVITVGVNQVFNIVVMCFAP